MLFLLKFLKDGHVQGSAFDSGRLQDRDEGFGIGLQILVIEIIKNFALEKIGLIPTRDEK